MSNSVELTWSLKCARESFAWISVCVRVREYWYKCEELSMIEGRIIVAASVVKSLVFNTDCKLVTDRIIYRTICNC